MQQSPVWRLLPKMMGMTVGVQVPPNSFPPPSAYYVHVGCPWFGSRASISIQGLEPFLEATDELSRIASRTCQLSIVLRLSKLFLAVSGRYPSPAGCWGSVRDAGGLPSGAAPEQLIAPPTPMLQ